jgi:antitoxin component of MazEF toxin-antitoxin module
MVITKIRKIGNSLGIGIPVPILNELNLSVGASVELVVEDSVLKVIPVQTKPAPFPFSEDDIISDITIKEKNDERV